MPPTVRPPIPTDRGALARCLRSDDTFSDREVGVALELIDHALDGTDRDYVVRVAVDQPLEGHGPVAGYICYGPTPMTQATFDLYWIVTHARRRGRGVASALMRAMEADLVERGATGIRIETSTLEGYDSARALYDRFAYAVVSRIPNFYRAGDDLITLFKATTAP